MPTLENYIKMKKIVSIIMCFMCIQMVIAQQIAILSPFYLNPNDTINDQILKNKLLNTKAKNRSGYEFYEGVKIAYSTIKTTMPEATLRIFDTKESRQQWDSIAQLPYWNNIQAIIAMFNNNEEMNFYANFAQQRHIPLFSATYSEANGIKDNHYMYLVSPTYRTYCAATINYINAKYAHNKIYLFFLDQPYDHHLADYFTTPKLIGNQPYNLQITPIALSSQFQLNDIVKIIDTTQAFTAICVSPNEWFGVHLLRDLAKLSTPITLIGNNTWKNIKIIDNISRNANNITISYPTTFVFNRTNSLGFLISNTYRTEFYGAPSDWVYKGFDVYYHICHTIHKYQDNWLPHISDNIGLAFHYFKFYPFSLIDSPDHIDFFENRNIYFITRHHNQAINIEQ